jgi:aryl-alcohol dehydrogenase-like predicted oxidoreductase
MTSIGRKIRAIGVSNYSVGQMETFRQIARSMPVAPYSIFGVIEGNIPIL